MQKCRIINACSPPSVEGTVEGLMKKTYNAPMLVPSGDVVLGTLGGSPNIAPESPVSKQLGGGAVGYYL